MGYIYKITNQVNGKVYIGQTSRSVEIRWQEHRRYARHDLPSHCKKLYNAMKKYGIEAFQIETIEECDDAALAEREQYWIAANNSYKNGYNSTMGGDGAKACDKLRLMELWSKGLSRNEIAETMGLCPETVTRELNWSGVTREDIRDRKRENVKPVHNMIHQYTADGEYIRSFKLEEVQDVYFNGRIPEHLGGKTFGGFQWRHVRYKRALPIHVKRPRKCAEGIFPPTPVHQYALDGRYIQSFESIGKASRHLGRYGTASIRKACMGDSRIGFGYRWSYEKVERLPPMRRNRCKRRVAVLDTDNRVTEVYDSIRAASKAYNLSEHTIAMVCNGTYEYAARTKFIYFESA